MTSSHMARRKNIIKKILSAFLNLPNDRVFVTDKGSIDISDMKRKEMCAFSGITDTEFGNNNLRDYFPIYRGVNNFGENERGIRINVGLICSDFFDKEIGAEISRLKDISANSNTHNENVFEAGEKRSHGHKNLVLVRDFMVENGLYPMCKQNPELAERTIRFILKLASQDRKTMLEYKALKRENPDLAERISHFATIASKNGQLIWAFQVDPDLVPHVIKHYIK